MSLLASRPMLAVASTKVPLVLEPLVIATLVIVAVLICAKLWIERGQGEPPRGGRRRR